MEKILLDQGVKTESVAIADEFPYAETKAAEMLRHALWELKNRHRRSARDVAKALGYKQPVVISHMASGRVAIPLEKAEAIAQETGLPTDEFLLSSIEQKIDRVRVFLKPYTASSPTFSMHFATEVADIAGTSLDDLNDEQKMVIREVASDPRPGRRWLSTSEIRLVNSLREAIPSLRDKGISEDLWVAILEAISKKA